MPSKNKREYPTEITDEQLRYLITAFENNMAEFYPVGREAEIARQLLSLREQLAELKALKPVAEVVSKFGDPEAFGEREIEVLIDLRSIPYGARLFTAAKPEALPRHIFSMLVNELRDVPAIGCKRELIVGALNRHGVIAEPVQCDPPAAE
ncbi:polyphosphate kinase [Yersinia proxima]|uniref:polyphosphate kinase n=1 Tax=Yersinia proxima TaxID=2890316 RepID=UPI001D11FC15|nr:polyphosphate kinase [Yersinia proxima]